MKKKPQIKKGATIIGVDTSLDKYMDMGPFQDKVDKANHILKTVGLLKQLIKRYTFSNCEASASQFCFQAIAFLF